MANRGFTGTQKQYLEGLASGLRLAQRSQRRARAAAEPLADGAEPIEEAVLRARSLQRLSPEEKAKRNQTPEDLWLTIAQRARERRFPEGDEVFLYKSHGLFYLSPVEEAFMCRLRFAAGRVRADQLRGVADLAERYGHPVLQLTTRSNIQVRGIGAGSALDVLTGLLDLGVVSRGTGADAVRNVCASPTGGFDRRELFDTGPLARAAHHRVLGTRGLWSLPRKFTLAFDGGGSVSALAETCDLGFRAVRVGDDEPGVSPGVYFRLMLGGATSHGRFGRDAGVVVPPERCIDVFDAVLGIYIDHGDRSNRRRARLAYLLESWGMERFLAELSQRLERLASPTSSGPALIPLPLERCELPAPPDPLAHIGFHNQRPRGKSYVGVVLPRAEIDVAQARGLADIADEFGSGELRLTPYQNLLIPGLSDTLIHRVKSALERLNVAWSGSSFRSGLLACTGSSGCRFAAADVKRRAEELLQHLESRFKLEQPLSIHVSGCHHACAHHAFADIGLLATRGHASDASAERYQLWLGGQVTRHVRFGREVASDVPASEVPRLLEGVIEKYFERRRPDESFRDFVGRQEPLELGAAASWSAP